jgi:hypothetical protein
LQMHDESSCNPIAGATPLNFKILSDA